MNEKRENLLKNYIKLLNVELLKPFFEKGYGFALLTELYVNAAEHHQLGSFELYSILPEPKHQYGAFRQFIKRLEHIDLVELRTSKAKRSKKLICLSQKAIQAVKTAEKQSVQMMN